MNVQDILLTAIESLAKTATGINTGIKESRYEMESDDLNNNLDYAVMSIIDVSQLLAEIRGKIRQKCTRSMLAELSTPQILDKYGDKDKEIK